MAQKLKGIYDAIDHGNYKNACKLCAAFVQKHPQHGLCRSLHAVALERCDRREEALQQCEEALRLDGSDDTVMSTVQVVYKRCRELARITAMYEAASAKQPDNEDLALPLFSAAVRDSDLAKAQQVATRLYSKFKKPKYLHWVVVSILLQQRGPSAPAAKALDLAVMMLLKAPVNTDGHTQDAKVPFSRGEQHLLLLHLAVLRLRGKYAEALQMLERCKAHVPFPGDLDAMRVRFRSDAGEMLEALALAKAVVVKSPDCWASAQDYIDLAFRCPLPDKEALPRRRASGSGEIEIPDHGSRLRRSEPVPAMASVEEVESHCTDDQVWNAFLLFQYLQQQSVGRGRTPRLAELEVRRRVFCANEEAAIAALPEAPRGMRYWRDAADERDVQAFIQSIGQYVARMGSKPYCFFDLKAFLHLLESSDLAPILELAGEGSESVVARMQYACRRPGSSSASLEQAALSARRWLERWAASRTAEPEQATVSGGTGPSACEEFLLLSLMTYVDMDRESCLQSPGGQRAYLLDAIALAEMAAPFMPHCFHLSVLLVLLYGALGCPASMRKWYARMDTKNIQHETLSYLLFDVLSSHGTREDTHSISRSILAFHEDMEKDTSDALDLAFRTGIYNRIPEYIDGLAKVSKSVLWGRALVEEVLFDLGQAQTLDAITECFAKFSSLLAKVAQRPTEHWEVTNQDRDLFNGLRALPLCTPMSSSRFVSTGPRSNFVMGAALVWESSRSCASTGASSSSSSSVPSTVGGLLLEGLRVPPGVLLRISSSALCAASLLFQRGASGAAGPVAEVLEGGRQAFQELGLNVEVADGALLAAGPHPLLRPWQCAFAACDAARSIAQAVSAAEPSWEVAERLLTSATAYIQAAPERLRGESGADSSRTAAEQLSAALAAGGEVMKHVWVLVNACTGAVLPVAIWCTTVLPKAGSGKKVKDGQEALHAVRVAVRSLLLGLQATLTEIQAGLRAAAAEVPRLRAALFVRPEDGSVEVPDAIGAAVPNEDLAKAREAVRANVAEGHKKLLQEVAEAIALQLALLKSRGAFKP